MNKKYIHVLVKYITKCIIRIKMCYEKNIINQGKQTKERARTRKDS